MNQSKYRPYPSYQATDVPWLGNIPRDWKVTEAKYPFEITLGKMLQNEPTSNSDLEVPYLKALHVQWDRVLLDELPTMWASLSDIKSLTVQKGDLLVCEGGEVGRASIVEENPPPDCIIQNALHLVKPKKNGNVQYLKYLLVHIAAKGWFDVLCNRATIAHFTSEKFKDLPIPLPSLGEQRAIAAFLDHETAKIDTLIAKKECLLELLAEKRQALITHAVTKGLDTHAPMKDSGVDWLGNIPQSWEVSLLKNFVHSVQTGPFGSQLHNEDYVLEGTPIITVEHLGDNYIVHSDNLPRVSDDDRERLKKYSLEAGDIVFSRVGSVDRRAIVKKAEDGWLFSGRCLRVRPNQEKLNSMYLSLFFGLDGFKDYIVRHAVGATMLSLNTQILSNVPVLVPSLSEQHAIADYLERQISRINRLSAKVKEAIEKLQERRIALISAAVTGQIDVRDTDAN